MVYARGVTLGQLIGILYEFDEADDYEIYLPKNKVLKISISADVVDMTKERKKVK